MTELSPAGQVKSRVVRLWGAGGQAVWDAAEASLGAVAVDAAVRHLLRSHLFVLPLVVLPRCCASTLVCFHCRRG